MRWRGLFFCRSINLKWCHQLKESHKESHLRQQTSLIRCWQCSWSDQLLSLSGMCCHKCSIFFIDCNFYFCYMFLCSCLHVLIIWSDSSEIRMRRSRQKVLTICLRWWDASGKSTLTITLWDGEFKGVVYVFRIWKEHLSVYYCELAWKLY